MGVSLGLTGKDSIAQSIRNILLTEKGSVPFRPRMGVGSVGMLDGNIDKMAMSLEIIDQINTYEPRVTVTQVLFRQGENAGAVKIAIKYTIKETGEEAGFFYN